MNGIGSGGVFVSYRRQDTRHVAGRLFDRLAERFGTSHVFMDVVSIEPGFDFQEAIDEAVSHCDVLLALIGQSWLSAVDEQGRRRLDNSDDLVLLEVKAALDRCVRVIPVLVDGTSAPRRGELPEVIADLTRRNGVRLDHETFDSDVGALMDVLGRIILPDSDVTRLDPASLVGQDHVGSNSDRSGTGPVGRSPEIVEIVEAVAATAQKWLLVRDALPRELGVHAAIQAEGELSELPLYIRRDIDSHLRGELEKGVREGCFVLLVGGSSVGKTRTLYEALLAVVPDWHLVQVSSIEKLREFADAPVARSVVWLDELQRYLGGERGLNATIVRSLRQAGLIAVGTLWPDEFNVRMKPRIPGHPDFYATERELLDMATVIDVKSSFSVKEWNEAKRLAERDVRIGIALQTESVGLIQELAAGPALLRWWQQAQNPYARAVITAAVDARLLEVPTALPQEFFREAVLDYLTPTQRAAAPTDWLRAALEYATTPLHGAAATLSTVDGGLGVIVGGFNRSWRHSASR